MAVSSMSMVFTWAVESVLIHLVGIIIVTDYLIYGMLAISSVSLLFHIVSAAAMLDEQHYIVSVSHLTCATACMISSFLRPLDSLSAILSCSLLTVAELVALGMVFASTDHRTLLFFEMRSHFALVIPLLLESVNCIDVLGYRDFGFLVTMVYTMLQLAPFDVLSLTSTFISDIVLISFFGAYGKWWSVFVLLWKSVVTGGWLLRVVLLNAYPDIFKVDVDYSVTVASVHGPWIESVIVGIIVIALIIVLALQHNYVIIFPIILCILWIIFYWIFKSKRELPTLETTVPSAPPASAVLQTTKRMMVWPRVTIPVREKKA